MKVAALYVERGGPYFTMPDVDPWDVARDARRYAGPLPVVAHPPCGPWGELRHLYQGGEHDCAPSALVAVRTWGGVFEHPKRSTFWEHASIRPMAIPAFDEIALDRFGGFAIDVDQCAWGHVARKRTRLYFVGLATLIVAMSVKRGGKPTHWVSGSRHLRRDPREGGRVPEGIKICSSRQRRRTPPAFARWLVDLAAGAVTDFG